MLIDAGFTITVVNMSKSLYKFQKCHREIYYIAFLITDVDLTMLILVFVVVSALVDGYVKVGDMASALGMHKKMLFHGCAPNVVTLTSLINGYCRVGRVNHGLDLRREIIARNILIIGHFQIHWRLGVLQLTVAVD